MREIFEVNKPILFIPGTLRRYVRVIFIGNFRYLGPNENLDSGNAYLINCAHLALQENASLSGGKVFNAVRARWVKNDKCNSVGIIS